MAFHPSPRRSATSTSQRAWGTQFPVIGLVFAGQTVQVLSMSANGWYQIACQSGGMVTCWITGSSRDVWPAWSWIQGVLPRLAPQLHAAHASAAALLRLALQLHAARLSGAGAAGGQCAQCARHGLLRGGQLAPWQVVQVTGVSADGYWYRTACPFYCPGDCWVSSQSWLVRPV